MEIIGRLLSIGFILCNYFVPHFFVINKNVDIKFSANDAVWNNLNQVCSKSKYLKAKEFKSLWEQEIKKSTNMVAKICYGHLCLSDENLSFINNN